MVEKRKVASDLIIVLESIDFQLERIADALEKNKRNYEEYFLEEVDKNG